MKTNANARPPGCAPFVVVESNLHKRMTKARLIELFEMELEKRNKGIEALKKLNSEQETALLKSQALNRTRFAQIDELQARVNIYQSTTAQIRLIESLDRQLETAREQVEYYKNLCRPVKTLFMGFYAPQKTCFSKITLSLN